MWTTLQYLGHCTLPFILQMQITEKKLCYQTIHSIAGRAYPSSAYRRAVRGKASEDWLFSVPDIKKHNFHLCFRGNSLLYFTCNSRLLYSMIMCPVHLFSYNNTHFTTYLMLFKTQGFLLKNKNNNNFKKSAKPPLSRLIAYWEGKITR